MHTRLALAANIGSTAKIVDLTIATDATLGAKPLRPRTGSLGRKGPNQGNSPRKKGHIEPSLAPVAAHVSRRLDADRLTWLVTWVSN